MSTATPSFTSKVLLFFLWMGTVIIGAIVIPQLIMPSVMLASELFGILLFWLFVFFASSVGSTAYYKYKYGSVFSRRQESSRANGEPKDSAREGRGERSPTSQSASKVVATVKAFLTRGNGLIQRSDEKDESTEMRVVPTEGTPGDTARKNGELQKAINTYEEALEKYEQAERQANGHEARLKEAIAETRDKLDTVRERKERIDAVRNPLQKAESSFQTAITQHAQSHLTPARRDYRQARDQYEQALDALDELEENLFEHKKEMTVAVTLEAESLPSKLIAWDYISNDEVQALSDAGIGTLSDIRNAGDELIQELAEHETIDEQLANRLRTVKWWHGEDERTFTNSKTIERQRDRAEEGHQMLS